MRLKQCFAGMGDEANLFDIPVSTIVPKTPEIGLGIANRERFVTGRSIPGKRRWADNGVAAKAFPPGQAVLKARYADTSKVFIFKTNREHGVSAVHGENLAGRDFVSLPGTRRVGGKNGFGKASPMNSIGAGGMTNGVGFVLFSGRVPHSKLFSRIVPQNVRTHDARFLPGVFRSEHVIRSDTFPVNSIGTHRITNPGVFLRLTGVPQVVFPIVEHHRWTVQILLPPPAGERQTTGSLQWIPSVLSV